MEIEKKQIEQIVIREKGFDPIIISIEDIADGKGRFGLSYGRNTFSYYWGCMGEGYDLRKFILSTNNHYLFNKFASYEEMKEYDSSKCLNAVKSQIIKERKEDGITKEKAKELFDQAELIEYDIDPIINSEFFFDVFGDEWWCCLPEKDTIKWIVFNQVMDLVRSCFKQELENVGNDGNNN